MSDNTEDLAITLFSEILTVEQLMRSNLGRALPKGMALSHFAVLNLLYRCRDERTPAQLAKIFHVTRGAMTNTLNKLEWAGYIHIRPDWDDARRKLIVISPAGRAARDAALAAIGPVIQTVVRDLGTARVKETLPLLRGLREHLDRDA